MEWYEYTLIIVAALVVVLVVGSLIFVQIAYNKTIKPSETREPTNEVLGINLFAFFQAKIDKNKERLAKLDYEDLDIINRDNIRLHGYLYRTKKEVSRPQVVLFLHPWRSSAQEGLAFINNFYYDFNFNVVAPDQVGCGKSDGDFTGFGAYDALDIPAWVEKINEIFNHNCDIFVHGYSTGATSALLGCHQEMENVVCFIVDSPFTNPYAEITYLLRKYPIPRFAYAMYFSLVKRKTNFDLRKVDTAENVKNSLYPIFFIHGKYDTFVPFEMGKKAYDAVTCYKDCYFTETKTHASSYLVDPIAFEQNVLTFIDQCKRMKGE